MNLTPVEEGLLGLTEEYGLGSFERVYWRDIVRRPNDDPLSVFKKDNSSTVYIARETDKFFSPHIVYGLGYGNLLADEFHDPERWVERNEYDEVIKISKLDFTGYVKAVDIATILIYRTPISVAGRARKILENEGSVVLIEGAGSGFSVSYGNVFLELEGRSLDIDRLMSLTERIMKQENMKIRKILEG